MDKSRQEQDKINHYALAPNSYHIHNALRKMLYKTEYCLFTRAYQNYVPHIS